jgi:hypothetical protein
MNIVLFFLVVYALSFAIVYKRPAIFRPVEWIMNTIGLGKGLDCMICMPMYIAAVLSALNLVFLPDITFSPALSLFGTPYNWWLLIPSYVFIDALSSSGMIYLLDQIQVYLENNYRGNSPSDIPQIILND